MTFTQPVWFCEETVIELSSVSGMIGMSAVKPMSRRLYSPPVTLPMKRASLPGVWVTTLIAPPMVLAPNSVPCGPFRISTRSTSSRLRFAPIVRARYTPSRYTPTPGFRLKAKSSCPMPRIEADSTDLSPENGAPASRLTLGVRLLSAWISPSARFVRVSELNAVTAIGTSCSFSSRRCAVTTTSDQLLPHRLRHRLRAAQYHERAEERLARVGTRPFRKREIHVGIPPRKNTRKLSNSTLQRRRPATS